MGNTRAEIQRECSGLALTVVHTIDPFSARFINGQIGIVSTNVAASSQLYCIAGVAGCGGS